MVKQLRFMIVFSILVLLIGFASAADSIIFNSLNIQETVYSLDQSTATGSVSVQCVGTNESKTGFAILQNNASLSVSAPSYLLNCSANETKTLSFTISGLSNKNSQLVFFNIENNNSINDTLEIIKVYSGDILEICGADYTSTNISVGDVDDGEDWDEDWRPLDKIKVSVEDIKNNADDDYKFDIELMFFKGNEDVSSDVVADSDDLEIDNFKIDEGDREDVEFNFQVDGRVDDGSYDVYLKVSNKDVGCYVKKIASIDVDKEEYYSIVNDVTGPSAVDCNERVELFVDVANIGEEDDDGVKVILYNRELGINLYKELGALDEGDVINTYFSFDIPKNATSKLYRLILSTEFEYDEDDEEYQEESDSDDDYIYSLNVVGSCSDSTRPTISAKLNSTAEVGKDLLIEIILTNNADQTIVPTIYADGYESWANFVGISPSSLSIVKKQSENAYLTLTPTKHGQQTFNIKVIYGDKITEQPITVTILNNQGWFSKLSDSVGKIAAFLIIAIVVVLLLIIAILIIRAIWYSLVGKVFSVLISITLVVLFVVAVIYWL